MRRLLLLVLFLPIFATAQSVKVVFANESPRKVWAAASETDRPPDVPTSSALAQVIGDPSGWFWGIKVEDSLLCVLDVKTGNLAVRPAKGLTTWEVSSSDFKLIGRVQMMSHSATPPAQYECNGRSYRVKEEGGGAAEFRGVEPGTIHASVRFERDGLKVEQSQDFVLSLKREVAVPQLVLSGAETTGAQVADGGAAPKSTSSPERVGQGGNLIGILTAVLIVAAFAIAILVFGLKWIYANQDKAQSALGKLGVQVPDQLDPGPDPVAAPSNPIPDPMPMTPIILPGSPPIGGAVHGGVPRLMGSVGSFELTDGVHVLGREAGLTISLVGESTLSRRHAEIVVTGNQITLRDLGSTNGTFVNGVAVSGDAALKAGDSVRFGAVTFTMEM